MLQIVLKISRVLMCPKTSANKLGFASGIVNLD